MGTSEHTKKHNFRLPDRTISKLDEIVASGIARNRTEALVWIVDVHPDTIVKKIGEQVEYIYKKMDE